MATKSKLIRVYRKAANIKAALWFLEGLTTEDNLMIEDCNAIIQEILSDLSLAIEGVSNVE